MHAFLETNGAGMGAHMKNWFGIVPIELEDESTGSYLACYCGAWLVPFATDEDGEVTDGAIWHQRKYKPKDE